jgi:BlaI family transcriptional regulator, penicillinase repressor
MAAESAGSGSRHSILDLAPLELDCMNALWPSGEATVRQIQEALRPTRPRAYTTIMTILDRLAQKGIVQRRKSGRAWVYRASLSAEEARTHAVSQVVDGFFGGSTGALATHLTGPSAGPAEIRPARLAPAARETAVAAAEAEERSPARNSQAPAPGAPPESPSPAGLDTALL